MTSEDNPFLNLADRQLSAPVKSRQKAAATRAKNAAEKKLEEGDKLLKLYTKIRRETLNAMLAGPFGPDVRRVQGFLRNMGPGDADGLVAYVQASVPWIKSLPKDHQYMVLTLIGNGIIRVREKAGLPPFDDGLPGDPPKAFEQIKQILGLS